MVYIYNSDIVDICKTAIKCNGKSQGKIKSTF